MPHTLFGCNCSTSTHCVVIINLGFFRPFSHLVGCFEDLDFSYQRHSLNRSFLLGGGVKYKIGKNFVYADLRYMLGLNNIVIPEKNFYNPDGTLSTSITKNQYVSDFFRLDNLSISFGYIAPLYDPRKIKKINTKGFFRNLFKPKAKTK